MTPSGFDLATNDNGGSYEDDSSDDDGSVTMSWDGQGESTDVFGDYTGTWAAGAWETGSWGTESTDSVDESGLTTDEN